MIREAIAKLVQRHDLDETEMVGVMDEIMGGEATPAQIAAFLTALRMKGETIEEITGGARVMRRKATPVVVGGGHEIVVDTCGTGGDGSGTFNVSTATAFVVAAAGLPVAKHGNRSVSSKCGSADVLEALGVNLSLTADQVAAAVREVGIGFLFAPALHGAMKHAIGPRREIGIRTVFNVLGPLTNPAGANVQVLGVYDRELTGKLASVLGRLGSRRALVVWGEGNLDEMTVTGRTEIAEWDGLAVRTWSVTPEEAGLARATLGDIKGGDSAEEAAALLRRTLEGAPSACLDMVLLNAAGALYAAGRAVDLKEGVAMARELVTSGAALAKLDDLVRFTQNV